MLEYGDCPQAGHASESTAHEIFGAVLRLLCRLRLCPLFYGERERIYIFQSVANCHIILANGWPSCKLAGSEHYCLIVKARTQHVLLKSLTLPQGQTELPLEQSTRYRVRYCRLDRYFTEPIDITGDSGTMPARAYRHAIGGLSVTGNLSDFRKSC